VTEESSHGATINKFKNFRRQEDKMKRTQFTRNISRVGVTLAAASLAAAFSSCNSSSSSSTPVAGAQTPCTNISNCTTSATGYTFPDGQGGTVACGTSGFCSDSTFSGSYNSGYAVGNSNPTAYNSGYNSGYSSGYAAGDTAGYDAQPTDSVAIGSKDTDLQKEKVQQAGVEQRAQFIANSFQMSVGAATQLTQLSDRVKQMAVAGQMTDADRAAVTKSALDIAGVSTDQVNDAITRMNSGDESAASALMQKAAVNLGMPSSAALRDKLLPALGVSMN
jgi:hypothetical protein